MTADGLVRLHISPLTPELLRSVIPASVTVSDVSYHELQTLSERNYGYVELAQMEAEKVRKRLSGSTLKGQKVRVEEARPKKRTHDELDDDKSLEATRRSSRGRADVTEQGVIRGQELLPERKVKRGWSDPEKDRSRKKPKSSAEQVTAKYRSQPEVLFKAKVPSEKSEGKRTWKHHKSRAQRSSDTVHEFKNNTTQPTFLRSENTDTSLETAEFIDGNGWINAQGQVIEGRLTSTTMGKARLGVTASSKTKAVQLPTSAADTSSSEGSVSSEDSFVDKAVHSSAAEGSTELSKQEMSQESDQQQSDEDDTSSVASSDSEEDDYSDSSTSIAEKSDSAMKEETPKPASTNGVHPLEALFKKPSKAASQDIAKPSLEIQTSFSFFDQEQTETAMPETPFNSQDQRSRSLRSAAPTPDTAAPSRASSWFASQNEDESDDSNRATPTPFKEVNAKPQERNDFVKWFWDNRSENNRAWKKRRREASKEKRQRENRQRGHKI